MEKWVCHSFFGVRYFFGIKRWKNRGEMQKRKRVPIGTRFFYRLRSSQKATALAAATFRESTPWYMGIFTV